jgi:hypothetical protein
MNEAARQDPAASAKCVHVSEKTTPHWYQHRARA